MCSVQSDDNVGGFFNGMVKLPNKTLAELGSPTPHSRMLAYTSDGYGGGPGIVYSAGTNWIRLDANAPASSS